MIIISLDCYFELLVLGSNCSGDFTSLRICFAYALVAKDLSVIQLYQDS